MRSSPAVTSLVVLVAFLALASPSSVADPLTPSISVATGSTTGAFYGLAREYVYDQTLKTDYKVSELDWPFQPLVFAGAAVSFDSAVGLFATLQARQGFSGKAGKMTDSDYLNGDGIRTHFSQSDSYVERANLLDLQAGWSFLALGGLRLAAFGSLSYMDFKWSARDGYYQYPTTGSPYVVPSSGAPTPGTFPAWSTSETETPLYGTGIAYEAAYLGAAVGLSTRYMAAGRFSIDASLAFTPLLYCYAEDNHFLRQLDFYSSLSRGFMIEPRVAFRYSLLPSTTLKLDVGYRYAWGLKGSITQISTGASDLSTSYPTIAGPDSAFTAANDSGADLSFLDAGLSLSVSL